MLSQADIVHGNPGPGGGFTLAKHPAEIRIHDIYSLFETENDSHHCPFGGGICGSGTPCPLHAELVEIQAATARFLHDTTLKRFLGRSSEPHADAGVPLTQGRRKSFRANIGRRYR